MLLFGLLIFDPIGPFTLNDNIVSECFALVKRFAIARPAEAEEIKDKLRTRQKAIWALTWGSAQEDVLISLPCTEILDEWKWQARLSNLVYEVGGDFDRFVNAILSARVKKGEEVFALAADYGGILDRYFIRKAIAHDKKWSFGLTATARGHVTPFHPYSAYAERWQPALFQGEVLRGAPAMMGKQWLARCGALDVRSLRFSIILCEGNMQVTGACTSCLIACGGNATVTGARSSLIIAAGDVVLREPAGQVFVIAGGTVTITTHTTGVFIVTPKSLVLRRPNDLKHPFLVLDQSPRPAPELFSFRDLWTDYGLKGALKEERVRLVKVKANGPLAGFFREGDVLVAQGAQKIASVGQFRRLLRYALDTGRLDFAVERDGKQVSIAADLKKVE